MRYSCGHVSTKKNVRGIKDAAASTPPQLRSSRYIRYRDNIGYPRRYGERYDIGDNQYSSNNLSYCPINRFLESVPTLSRRLSRISHGLLGLSIPGSFPIPWDLLRHHSSLLPPPTLWLPHFASCLPHLQQTPFHFAQARPLLHRPLLRRVGPSSPTAHRAQTSTMYIYSDKLINDSLNN